ncbi:MAG: glycogen/starch/alpha-glucan phosphorylase [Candidatus Zixiibacteriota bacterium]
MGFENNSIYFTDGQALETYSLENQIAEHLEFRLAKNKITSTPRDFYTALALSIRDRMIRKWIRTQQQYVNKNVKKVFYLSMEFLMGRLMGNALISLGFYDECKRIMADLGHDLEDIIAIEEDMGLGNGGLGRLAAGFLDSMATLELPAYGYGIRYEYGIFKQDIENGYQIERPDNWLRYGNPWEIMRPELTYRIRFGGRVTSYLGRNGKDIYQWIDTDDVLAMAYDVPIPGFWTDNVNNLRLWEAKATHEFNFTDFNRGNYTKAVENKYQSETISKVLYPNDNMQSGKELRLKQQYFFVSATLQDIIRKFKINNDDFELFSQKTAIHLNDTHPSLAIPELMRIFVDEEGLEWDKAWQICKGTFAYTNHTVLSEALETWSAEILEKFLPRHLQIIEKINFRFLEKVRWHSRNDENKISRMSIFQEGHKKRVRMANLSIIGSHSVNGVARLHTEIIKNRHFKDFYEFQPKKFNSKTNGITQRRWLLLANRPLADSITERIGADWVKDLYELKKIEKYIDDDKFRKEFKAARKQKKDELYDYIEDEYDVKINRDSLLDVQVKRLHEYKRQLMNAMHVIHIYNTIKDNPNGDFTPRTVIFAGKAAPGYYMSKMIIKLINSISNVINNDPEIGDKLKVIFLKNYSVSLAERIMPATDLSEQISTAGYEASGTGNMKFQLNGAITVGTLDGANIEIKEEVGDDNIFIFGKTADEIQELYSNGYNPREIYEENKQLKRVLDMINDNFFNPYEPGIFKPIFEELVNQGDHFAVLADFQSYVDIQEKISEEFLDSEKWITMSIRNMTRSGKFSCDRTIQEYAHEIWKIKGFRIKVDDKIPVSKYHEEIARENADEE